ncbi:MAG: hypothetical protein MI865_01040 [Proteobacteria bacterium]|nr:hypothetical protein [Pseudomonadota bacterium]
MKDELTQAGHTKARRAAENAKIRPLVACADPGNMPMLNMKDEGYDNRVVKLPADAMGTTVRFSGNLIRSEDYTERQCHLSQSEEKSAKITEYVYLGIFP